MIALITQNTFQIILGDKYIINNREYDLIKDAPIEKLNLIGIREVIFPMIEENEMYSGKYELKDGEVYALKIDKPLIPKIFDNVTAKNLVWQLLDYKITDLLIYQYSIDFNIDNENFKTLNIIINDLFSKLIISNDDLNSFRQIFLDQNIDITTY